MMEMLRNWWSILILFPELMLIVAIINWILGYRWARHKFKHKVEGLEHQLKFQRLASNTWMDEYFGLQKKLLGREEKDGEG